MLINCDMGESFGPWKMGHDEALMPLVDMANIACGFHASEPHTMARTVALAKRHNVAIVAHPSYPDLQGFGRRPMHFTVQQIEEMVSYQLGALQGICRLHKVKVQGIKPHGALYHAMMSDVEILHAIMRVIARSDMNIFLVLMAQSDNTELTQMAKAHDVRVLFEGYGDRAYNDNGMLCSRSETGAVHNDVARILTQLAQLQQGYMLCRSGKRLNLQVDTVCLHGDNPLAWEALKRWRQTH